MSGLRTFIRRSLTPVSIMVIPHAKGGPVKLKASYLTICACFVLIVVGLACVAHVVSQAQAYYRTRMNYRAQMRQMKSTLASLKNTEDEVKALLSLKHPRAGGREGATGDMTDMDALMRQVRQTIDGVAEIKAYLSQRHDVFFSAPAGLPVSGSITSLFGPRTPTAPGMSAFHHGIDIRAAPGTPVRATADGIVSFSGWMRGGGNVVVVEHGFGYSTAYAHASRNLVDVGQRVKRGDVLAASGATGHATGPHVHYEVWEEGRQVDPLLPTLASLATQARPNYPRR